MRQFWHRAAALLPHSDFLDLSAQRSLLASRPRARLALLAVGLLLIPLWQHSFHRYRGELDARYRNQASVGAARWQMPFYFLYHSGYFPVRTTEPLKGTGKEEVLNLLRERGPSLSTEMSVDQFQVMLYYPAAWSGGNAFSPSYVPANRIVFTLGLIALFAACWWVRLETLGVLLVLLLGANPFQVYEVYNENVFSWPISVGLLLVGAHLPFVGREPPRRLYMYSIVILTGVVLGTVRHIRSEIALMGASALAAYVLMSGVRRWQRALLPVLCVGCMYVTGQAWEAYFKHKQLAANELVRSVGGLTAPDLTPYHPHWHPIWCGLGDFDDTYGYLWDDRVAYAYALPVQNRTGQSYDDVLIGKIASDIKRDPVWFADIMLKRIWRVLAENTPARLAVGKWGLDLPVPGMLTPFLALVAICCLLLRRNWPMLKVLAFPIPLAGTALLVYSGGGVHYYSVLHLFVVGYVVLLVFEGVLRYWGGHPEAVAPGAPASGGN